MKEKKHGCQITIQPPPISIPRHARDGSDHGCLFDCAEEVLILRFFEPLVFSGSEWFGFRLLPRSPPLRSLCGGGFGWV
jgi:hypothetical protein